MCSYIALKILRNKQTNKTKTTNKQTNKQGQKHKKIGQNILVYFPFSFSVMIIVLAWDDNDMFFFLFYEKILCEFIYNMHNKLDTKT